MRSSSLPEVSTFTGTDYLVMDNSNKGTKRVSGEELKAYLKTNYCKRYGYRVKLDEPDPALRVEYLYDAVGMVPASMNFGTAEFEYGSWGDIWFVAKNFPCMLKTDGTIDYKLDPSDYSKRENGAASQITDTTYSGNAMSAIPRVWYKRWQEGGYRYFVCAEEQYDPSYYADVFERPDGSYGDYKYMAIYDGTMLDGALRSLSGYTPSSTITYGGAFTACQANGSDWIPHDWSTHCLIADLLTLMSKSTDNQTAFGKGRVTSDSGAAATGAADLVNTGTLNRSGQFYGYYDTMHAVKVFHMENLWGNLERMVSGFYANYGKAKVAGRPSEYMVTQATHGSVPVGGSLAIANSGSLSRVMPCRWGYLPAAVASNLSEYECCGHTIYTWSTIYQVIVRYWTDYYGNQIPVYEDRTAWHVIDEAEEVHAACGGSAFAADSRSAGMLCHSLNVLPTTTSDAVGTSLTYRYAK